MKLEISLCDNKKINPIISWEKMKDCPGVYSLASEKKKGDMVRFWVLEDEIVLYVNQYDNSVEGASRAWTSEKFRKVEETMTLVVKN